MAATENAEALESALDELYGVEPGEFVATRKRIAGELRTAGEKDAAKSLLAARRPTLAAWALNQLARREPSRVEALLERSRDLEAAQRGGHRDVRAATREQREALGDATDAALDVLGERATETHRSQVRATLQAAAADAEVAEELRRGRFVRELSGPTGFTDFPGLTLVPDLPPEDAKGAKDADRASERKRTAGPPDADRRDAAAERAERAEQAARIREERERAAAEAAARRLAEAEQAAETARSVAEAADAALVAVRERVNALARELEEARSESRRAEDDADRARREADRLIRALTRLRAKG